MSSAEVTTLITASARWLCGARRGVNVLVIGQSNAVNSLSDGAWNLCAQGLAWHLGAASYGVIGNSGRLGLHRDRRPRHLQRAPAARHRRDLHRRQLPGGPWRRLQPGRLEPRHGRHSRSRRISPNGPRLTWRTSRRSCGRGSKATARANTARGRSGRPARRISSPWSATCSAARPRRCRWPGGTRSRSGRTPAS